MHPRQGADPALHRLNVSLDVFASREPDNGLRKRQRILGAVIDFPGQQALAFFRPLPFGDVNGDAADADPAAALVDRSGGGADAPANLAVRPNDSKLRFIGSCTLVELRQRL